MGHFFVLVHSLYLALQDKVCCVKTNRTFASRVRSGACVVCVCLFFVWGCTPSRTRIPYGHAVLSVDDLLQAGNRAWEGKDYLQVRTVYSRLLFRGGEPGSSKAGSELAGAVLSEKQLEQCWERYAFSLFYLGQLSDVRQAMEQWSKVQPGVQDTWPWIRLSYLLVAKESGLSEAESFLQGKVSKNELPFGIRLQILQVLIKSQLAHKSFEQAFYALTVFYQSLQDNRQRLELEEFFRQLLKELDREKISAWYVGLPADTLSARQYEFPCLLLAWEQTKAQLLEHTLDWPQAFARLQDMLNHSSLVMTASLRDEFKALQGKFGPPKVNLALLLPLDGPYRDLSWKILQGADLAQWEEVCRGVLLNVQVINTQDPEWMEQLAALTGAYRLVGGPLLKDSWRQVLDKGFAARHVFFVMCPDLEPGKEGQDGFRFFPSKVDQVRTLLDFVQGSLGKLRLAVLYPRGEFGRQLAELFVRRAQARGMEIRGLQSYNPERPKTWQHSVARLLGVSEEFFQVSKEEQEKIILSRPDPDFDVVFIPDSFSHVQMLIPEFFFFNEDRLVFLGPALWSQEKIKIGQLDKHFFALTAMPGPWTGEVDNVQTDKLQQAMDFRVQGEKPDFWVGLGYDFVRLATELDVAAHDTDSNLLVDYLSRENFSWSIAPIKWDHLGRASEQLYMLQPRTRGAGPLQVEKFKALWLKIRSRPRIGLDGGLNATGANAE